MTTQREKVLAIKVFGKYTIINPVSIKGSRYVTCKCDCGKTKDVRVDSLLNGDSSSCGCGTIAKRRQSSHATKDRSYNVSDHVFYNLLMDIHRRCYNKNRDDYKHYGGRGIAVCKRWHKSTPYYLDNFTEDMGSAYRKGLEIERIDVNGDYCPENCIWVDRRTQVNNLRTNRELTWGGITLSTAEVCHLAGLDQAWISDRLNKLEYSNSMEEMFSVKFLDRQYKLLHDGVIKSAKQVLEESGYTESQICRLGTKYGNRGEAAIQLCGAVLIEEREKAYISDFNIAFEKLKEKINKSEFDLNLINKIERRLSEVSNA